MCDIEFGADEGVWHLIEELKDKPDLTKELLRTNGDHRRQWAIMQADCRRRAQRKLPQKVSSLRFVFPSLLSVEQCTSEALAEFHASLVPSLQTGVDLTAGLGVDAIALSQISCEVTAVERDEKVVGALRHNLRQLGITNLRCDHADSAEWVERHSTDRYGWIFVDPARRGEHGQRLYSINDCSPDVVRLLPYLRKMADLIIIKASPMLDITETVRSLKGVRYIYTTGTETECKELVAVIDGEGSETGNLNYHAVTLTHYEGIKSIRISGPSDSDGVKYVPELHEGMFVVEPWPSIMKYQSPGWLCREYGLMQIARDTHLYVTTKSTGIEFPGRLYVIESVWLYGKRECNQIGKENRQLNVTTRNFPVSAFEVAKRLKIKQGGAKRLFAVTGPEGKKMLLLCS